MATPYLALVSRRHTGIVVPLGYWDARRREDLLNSRSTVVARAELADSFGSRRHVESAQLTTSRSFLRATTRGARVEQVGSPVRIPAPERHDDSSVATRNEREVESFIDHGSA